MAERGKYIRFTDKVREIIKTLARKGFTDVEMSEIVGITERTFNNWKTKNADFFQSLKEWKEKPDKEVERSLFERAMGYEHPEDKIFNHAGEPLVVPTIKHYPPDTTAIIFWLKNRQPDKWRDVKAMQHEGEINMKHDLSNRLEKALNEKKKQHEKSQ